MAAGEIHLLMIKDHASKFVWLFPTAETTAELLENFESTEITNTIHAQQAIMAQEILSSLYHAHLNNFDTAIRYLQQTPSRH